MANIKVVATADQIPTQADFPSWANPNNLFYESEWQVLRDCLLGSKQVKSRRTEYLRKNKGFDKDDYEDFLHRATFYNMIARTVSGMLGTLFRRNPMASDVPGSIDINSIGFEKQSLWSLMRNAGQEVIHVSRLGALVDRSAEGESDPYITLYPVESIINWRQAVVNGRKIPVDIILREYREYEQDGQPNKTRVEFRRLVLQDGMYQQWVYGSTKDRDADITDEPTIIVPTRRGVPLDFIPFEFINATSNLPDVEKPWLLDVAHLNLSHYRSSAELEHGRYYTGQPIWYCNTDADKGEFTIGPSVVWQLPLNGKAGIMEFNGTGLKALENALEEKESQAASLGGRLIGVSTASTAESDNMTAMKERNENALLLNIAFSLENAFTKLLRYCAWWKDESDAVVAKIEVECSKDFMLKPVGAREFRAMHMMYTDGLIPVEVMFDYLRRAEVIPDYLSLEEFEKLLQSKNSFPGQPDADARLEGYPSMQSKLNDDLARDELDQDLDIHDDEIGLEDKKLKSQEKQAEAARKTQEKNAKAQAAAAAKAQSVQPKPGDPKPTVANPNAVPKPAAR